MRNIAYDILAGILLLVVGFAIGWHAKGVSVRAGETTAAHAETAAVVADVNHQAAAQHKDAVAEQGKSVALGIEQNAIRTNADTIQAEIDRAQFTTPAPHIDMGSPTIEVTCPPDPVGSDEFVRLYDAAAHGEAPAASSSTTTR